jgi:hypothetical protein
MHEILYSKKVSNLAIVEASGRLIVMDITYCYNKVFE